MRFSLPAMIRRANPGMRRTRIVIRDIAPPAMFATDLYTRCYSPVVAIWDRAIPRIVAEYERSLSQLTTDSPADLQAALDAADSELERIFLLLTADLRDWTLRTETWWRGKWRGAVLSATGVDLGTLLGPEDVRASLERTIEWNTALIKDVSAESRRRIGNAVFSGLTERRPAREVAKQIRDSVAMSRRRSINIASDQLSKLTSSLADERRREAGISRWKWRWSRKKHGREVHIARDGKVYADTAAGADPAADVLAPPADRPGQLPWCGCRGQAVIDLS